MPAALWQLVAVEDEVARLTGADDHERKLREQVRRGNEILYEFHEYVTIIPGFGFPAWAEETAKLIRAIADDTEEGSFRLRGEGQGQQAELVAKLTYLRDELWPKVRAGYWAT